jgi:hypothetical protein
MYEPRAGPGFSEALRASCHPGYELLNRHINPWAHLLRIKGFAKRMDCRIKPGNDGGN